MGARESLKCNVSEYFVMKTPHIPPVLELRLKICLLFLFFSKHRHHLLYI